MVFVTRYTSPFGRLLLFRTERGLCGIGFDDPAQGESDSVTIKNILNPQVLPEGEYQPDSSSFDDTISELDSYFSGKLREFSIPIDLSSKGTPFQHKVWSALQEIPYGTTMTYGDLAKKIGNAKAARAVGLANNRNPLAIVIPCHRVVGANGNLVGYAGGLSFKQSLLELEGVKLAPDPGKSNRESVLQAAALAFSQSGYKGTTIDEIAERSRINKRMVYHYFGTKHGLYEKVLQRLYQPDGEVETPALELDAKQLARLSLFSYLEATPTSRAVAEESLIDYEQRIRNAQAKGELDAKLNSQVLAQLNWLVDQFGSLLPHTNQTGDARLTLRTLLKTLLKSRSRLRPVVARRA